MTEVADVRAETGDGVSAGAEPAGSRSIGGLLRKAEIDLRLVGMVIALIAILIGFTIATNGRILQPVNLVNLSVQMVSIAVIATSCCASTSSGLDGMRSDSMAPPRIRSVTTADCTRSPRYLGNTTPRKTAPTWWPARPIRCSPDATLGGASTWTTRSTAPMSMPSSRLDVATTQGSSPAFSSSSTRVRCSRAIEPWWAFATVALTPVATPDCPTASAGNRLDPPPSGLRTE